METKSIRVSAAALCFALAYAGAGCKGTYSRVGGQSEDAAPQLAPFVRMADPTAKAQLSGFNELENGAWRWTTGKFSATLRVPATAAQTGATLNFTFTLPDVVLKQLQHIALTASIGDNVLGTEEYETAGRYVFTKDIVPSLLKNDTVKIDFMLDRIMPKGADKRDLGVIAHSVGITVK